MRAVGCEMVAEVDGGRPYYAIAGYISILRPRHVDVVLAYSFSLLCYVNKLAAGRMSQEVTKAYQFTCVREGKKSIK